MSHAVDELPRFFEPHHRGLADRLAEIEELPADPAAAAAAMGADLDLYSLLAPAGDATPDVRGLCLVRERLGAVAPGPDAIYAVQGLGVTPLRLAGHPDVELVDAARRGEAIFGFALTEPEAGSDVASLRTVAVARDGGGYVLHGDKTLISNVGIATHYTVFANADPDAGRAGISAFLVPADAPGLVAVPMEVAGDHPIGSLRFDGVEVDAEALVGEIGGGFHLAMRTLDVFRVTVGAAACGMAGRAFELAMAHAGSRIQFGGPLADKQIIQAYLADMSTELAAARMLVYRAALAVDGGAGATLEVAQAKLYATETANRIIDRAVQIHGGRGVVVGEEVEALYRAIRPLRIYEGASEIQKLIIYRQLSRGR